MSANETVWIDKAVDMPPLEWTRILRLMESEEQHRRERDLRFRLLVFPCARCQGYTDTLREGLCLTCHTRPWQDGRYRNPEEVQTWKP